MHELGHNLGFRHGGADNVNCKPNYLSVMSYSRQFSNLISTRPLDYSRDDELTTKGVITLDEVLGLNESLGIGNGPFPAGAQTVFGSPTGLAIVVPVPGQIDWNQNKKIQLDLGDTVDVNNLPAVGCAANGFSQLVGFNDWANVHYNLRASLEFAGGADTEQTEPTAEQEAAGFASVDSDGNGVPDGFQCAGLPGTDPSVVGTAKAACLIDVKPGDPFNISNLVSPLQGVLPAALLGSQFFDPTRMVDVSTLTLNGQPVQLKNNGTFQCSMGDVSGPAGVPDGFKDLLCKFGGISFPTVGSFYVILEGNLLPQFGGGAIRARDVVNVSH
jgi:hypothetical protein